ncbi:hypothetical protein SVAN01_05929 [Stagonosporopsis vannaccii]|nr:hypothetical protein SVAN01_05929 [Stagonosporopsis vannaccii]
MDGVAQLSLKMQKKNSARKAIWHTLHTPSTCIVGGHEAEASPRFQGYQGSGAQQTGRWGPQRCLDSRIGVTAVRETKPMDPNLAVGGPALASLIASPHDMARLAHWRVNRGVFDIVTFLASQRRRRAGCCGMVGKANVSVDVRRGESGPVSGFVETVRVADDDSESVVREGTSLAALSRG